MDVNNISGFLANCDNGAYLYDLRGLIDERLSMLGYSRPGAVAPPKPVAPQPMSLLDLPADPSPEPLVKDESDPDAMGDFSHFPKPLQIQLEEGWKKRQEQRAAEDEKRGEKKGVRDVTPADVEKSRVVAGIKENPGGKP